MKSDRLYLIHILESFGRIEQYAYNGRSAFMSNTMIQDAIIRNFEVIGEAAKKVSQSTREQAPDIPWRTLSGFRDILIHRYDDVDLEEVWQTVENDVHGLREQISRLLNSEER